MNNSNVIDNDTNLDEVGSTSEGSTDDEFDNWYRGAPYLKRTKPMSPIFWILNLLDSDGDWKSYTKTTVHITNVADSVREAIQKGLCKPSQGDKPTPALAFTYKINAEISNPGTNLEAQMILSAASGNLERIERIETTLKEEGRVVPLHAMAIAAISNAQAAVVQFCVDRSLDIDEEISFETWRAQNSEVFKILWPLNVLGLKEKPEWMAYMLEDVARYGIGNAKYQSKPENNPDALPFAEYLLRKGAKVDKFALKSALKYNSFDFFKLLVERFPRQKLRSLAALHYAAMRTTSSFLEYLLNLGLNVNKYSSTDLYGEPREPGPILGYALNHAIWNGRAENVQILLKRGANPRLEFRIDTHMEDIDSFGLLRYMREQGEQSEELRAEIEAALRKG